MTLPSATANFLMTDTSTQILDDPEIRVVDGQTAKLRIGDRIPVATGSFQPASAWARRRAPSIPW